MAKAVKLADIAKPLGVSVVTVSKALSGQKGVSDEMRAKIVELADKLGYVQPSAAKREQISRSHNIGVLIQEDYIEQSASFYWNLYQQVARITVEAGSFTMMEVITRRMEEEILLPRLLLEQKVDGLLIIGPVSENYLIALNAQATPLMYLDFADRERGSDAVISDSFYGAALMTDYLIANGHRKIGFVGTVLATNAITDRYLGYVKSLMEHGLEPKPEWVIDDRAQTGGGIEADRYLQLPKDLPTAFFCNCDLTGGLLIRKLESVGLRVPEDVSIVGFDNYIYPGICDIEITSYDVNATEMAQTAVDHLLAKIEERPYRKGQVMIEGCLVEKDSVRKLKK